MTKRKRLPTPEEFAAMYPPSPPKRTPTPEELAVKYGAPLDHDTGMPNNRERVGRAEVAIATYVAVNGDHAYEADDHCYAQDLITDLLHVLTFHGHDTEEILARSVSMFREEVRFSGGYGAR